MCGIEEMLQQLRVIYISHMHADHHLGLVRILLERQRVLAATDEPTVVVGPPALRSWLDEYRYCTLLGCIYCMFHRDIYRVYLIDNWT